MTDTEYAKAIQAKVTMANLEINAALTTEQQAQIGQDFIADMGYTTSWVNKKAHYYSQL